MGFELDLVCEKNRFKYIKENYGFQNLIYMGDGYHDAKILKESMFGIAPKNARKEAREGANFVTETSSGEGAVLDACLKIIEKFELK